MPAEFARPPMHIRTDSSGTGMFDATLPMLTPEMFANISAMGAFDDDQSFGFDDIDEEKDVIGDLPGSGKKGKLGSSTAEKKATHNAVERARRESLNGRFLVLADMIPGMTHVKRASKAAIVNKSIEYIKELQAVESKMAKENNKLKTEIAALKAAAKDAVASQESAAVSAPLASPFPGAVPALASPVVPTFPTGALTQSPHARQASFSASTGGSAPISLPSMEFSSIAPPQASPSMNVFHASQMLDLSGSHMFPQGMPIMPQQAQEQFAHKRSDSASPASQVSSLPAPPKTADSAVAGLQQQQQQQAHAQAQAQALASLSFPTGNYFELAGLGAGPLGTVASPTSYNGNMLFQNAVSDNSTASSTGLAASTNTAPSPASSYSVQTPGNNAYSPASVPAIGGELCGSNASNTAGSPRTNSMNAPAVNDSPSVAAVNEANAIAKAQADLQTFMAYQQRMAAAAAMNMNIAAAASNGNNAMNPFAAAAAAAAAGMLTFSPHHHHAPAPVMPSGSPNNPFVNVPAWQMMMAQQAALSAYGGANGPF